jgi:hypothetical protein
MTTTPPPLAADLHAGLRRLKLAAMRRLAPELLITAKTQRWNLEEFLRTGYDTQHGSVPLAGHGMTARFRPSLI